jgi:hypothetical protein
MTSADVFIVEWGTILRDLQRARPTVPDSIASSSYRGVLSNEYAMSSPRTVAIVAAQKFAGDFDLPKGKNSTVLPASEYDNFWKFVEDAIRDAILVWDRETNNEVLEWADGVKHGNE